MFNGRPFKLVPVRRGFLAVSEKILCILLLSNDQSQNEPIFIIDAIFVSHGQSSHEGILHQLYSRAWFMSLIYPDYLHCACHSNMTSVLLLNIVRVRPDLGRYAMYYVTLFSFSVTN